MSRGGGGAAARGLGFAGLRASSLVERRSLVDRCAVGVAASPFDDNEAARVDGLLARWRNQSPFDREDGEIWWRRRLEAEGLSEEELRLLARSPESLADSPAAASLGSDGGDWVDAVERSLAAPSPEPVPWPRAAEPPHRPDSGPFALLRIVEPLVADARRRFADGIEALASDLPEPPPFEPRRALELLFEGLPPRLTVLLGRTLVMELQVARLEERLVGDTPEERFASFVREQSRPDALRELLARYPVLARRLVAVLDAWVETSLEFLRHLAEDASLLSRSFADAGSDKRVLGMLTEARIGAGDRHRAGRTVIRVRFETPDGGELRLVYKPRSLAVEARFQELLKWLGDRGLSTPFRTLEVLEHGDHGWVELVETRPCGSKAEVERFFHRQGAYLALLDLLQATDFHHENLVAVGEHPVLVDLEALFHPWVESREIRRPDRSFGHPLRDTVLRVGLLPQRVWGDRDRAGVDLSGLGAAEGQVLPKAGLQIEHGDTDRMRFSPGQAKLPPPASRARLDGSDVELVEHAGALEAGFRETLDLCRRHRDALTAPGGPLEAFRDAEVRVVFRPTRGYALLLLEATHPHVQGDGLELDRLLDRLWSGVPDRPFLEALIPCERRDLWRGDVPRFTTRPGSRDLVASDGETLEGFFGEPALERVKLRLETRLTEEEIRRQSWILEGSLQAVRLERRELERPSYHFREAARPPTREALLATSRKAATRLAELALTGSEEAHWLAVQATAADTWSLAPATPDLYLGLPGIALFLGFLGVLDPERRHRDRWTGLARKTLETQRRQIDEAPESVPGIGGYNGWGGVVYGLVRLAGVWEHADLLDQAEEIAERHVAPAVPEDEHLDLMAGSAGCLSVLLALARARPRSVALDLARGCGERLLEMAVPQRSGIGWPMRLAGSRALAGLSHGAAGFALALLRLATATGETRFRDAALEALAYERSLYSPEHRNWPDLRQGAEPPIDLPGSSPGVTEEQLHGEGRFMCAWCHGAAGVGLARVAGLPHLDTAQVREEIAAAVGTTLESGFGRNHSLCHGDLGNLLFLQQAARALDDRELEGRVGRCAGGVLAGIEEHGFLPGLARGTEPPGLMVGLAGMGWALLRLAEPQRVPDVLTLS